MDDGQQAFDPSSDLHAGTRWAAQDLADLGGAHPVDRHVGLRIRMRRMELGVTQDKLAQALRLTFQQVQKYERGANRVSASKLWEVSRVLHAPIGYFYDGLAHGAATSAGAATLTDAHEFLLTSEGLELATTFPKVSRRLRRTILELVRTMAETDEEPNSS